MKKKSMNSNNNGGLSPSGGGMNGIMNFPLANSQNKWENINFKRMKY